MTFSHFLLLQIRGDDCKVWNVQRLTLPATAIDILQNSTPRPQEMQVIDFWFPGAIKQSTDKQLPLGNHLKSDVDCVSSAAHRMTTHKLHITPPHLEITHFWGHTFLYTHQSWVLAMTHRLSTVDSRSVPSIMTHDKQTCRFQSFAQTLWSMCVLIAGVCSTWWGWFGLQRKVPDLPHPHTAVFRAGHQLALKKQKLRSSHFDWADCYLYSTTHYHKLK